MFRRFITRKLKFEPASAGVASWAPTDVAGLQFWLKADTIEGLNDGDAVTTWEDSSGNNNDATQSEVSLKPTYKVSIINGKPVVRFNNNRLAGAGTLSITGETLTAFAVVAINSSSADYGRVISLSSPDNHDFNSQQRTAAILRNASTANVEAYRNNDLSNAAISYATFYYVVSIYDGANHVIYLNGSASSGVASTGTFAISTYAIGDNYGASTAYLNGDIAECGVYNSNLSGGTLSSLHSYLASKYAL